MAVRDDVTPPLYRPLMGLPIPQTLSPSSMGCYTSCPLAFKFSYVQRLPEPRDHIYALAEQRIELRELEMRRAEDDAAAGDLRHFVERPLTDEETVDRLVGRAPHEVLEREVHQRALARRRRRRFGQPLDVGEPERERAAREAPHGAG